jgi:uncharacterized protein GlcG (DUF336 family)
MRPSASLRTAGLPSVSRPSAGRPSVSRPSVSRIATALLLTACVAAPALAQQGPPPPRARGPALELAVEAAQIAVRTCLANGYRTTALVTDSAGVPVAMLSADGAAAITQVIAPRKIATVMRYKVASGVVAERLKTDAALAQAVKDDPAIAGMAWPGAFPLMAGDAMVGAIAVSGAPGGDKDEACARPAIAAIAARLK